jgi:hypothetical protein
VSQPLHVPSQAVLVTAQGRVTPVWIQFFINLIANLNVGQVGSVGTVADLGPPVEGGRGIVNDATSTTFGSVVVGGGGNTVPVYSGGTNWRIG